MALPPFVSPPAPVDLTVAPDHLATVGSVTSSAWHGVWQFATTSPWFAIALMVPAIALLVRCTRITVHRG